jgi:hypothetical protein
VFINTAMQQKAFSEQETRQLKDALCYLAKRIKKSADKI